MLIDLTEEQIDNLIAMVGCFERQQGVVRISYTNQIIEAIRFGNFNDDFSDTATKLKQLLIKTRGY